MAEKKIQARIRQKVDTKANWDKATNFVPLKGEVIIYSDLNQAKIGDGVTKVSALPFLKGKADASDKNPTLAWGTKSIVATVDGVDLHVTMPSNPNTHQSVTDKNPTLAWGTKSAVATIGSTNIHVTMPANPVPSNYVTTNTKQTITGEKTFNAPATASGEQATAIFKTANGGQIIFGKEGPNSGSMIALDQEAGTRRLNFRASATPGAIVWSQPESGSSLYYDVSNVYFRETGSVILNQMPNYSVLATDSSGKIIKGSPVQGPKGDAGAAGGFGTPTATVDANVGTPSVTITSSGPNTAKVFNFAFKNLKGAKGADGHNGTNGTSVTVSSIQYQAGSSNTTAPTGTWSNTVVAAPAGQYLWTKTNFSNGSSAMSVARQGKDGANGTNGTNGAPGAAATIAIGTVTTGAAGSSASVTNAGDSHAAKFNFVIPRGHDGTNGHDGAAAGFGSVTATVDANVGTPSVTVTPGGTNAAKTFAFAFKNLKGEKGATGAHISSVTGDKTPAEGNTVTYTMKNSDGTTAGTFKVVNGTKGSTGPAGSVASFKAGSGSGNVITGLTLNNDKSVTYDKAVNALDMGSASTVVNQVVYNPVEMKKALTVPSIQGTKYTDNSGAQHSLFELGGTADNISGSSSLTFYRNRAGTWDSATIAFTLADGLKIGDYVVGVQSWASIPSSYILTNKDGVTKNENGCVRLTTTGGTSDDFSFNSFKNGKLHSKITFGNTGPEGGGWCIDNSKILTESSLSTQQWKLTSTAGTVTTVNICTK